MADRDRVEARVELGEKPASLVVDGQLPFLDEAQDRGGGELLRYRADLIDRVDAGRHVSLAIEKAVRADEVRVSLADGDREAGNAVGDRSRGNLVDPGDRERNRRRDRAATVGKDDRGEGNEREKEKATHKLRTGQPGNRATPPNQSRLTKNERSCYFP